MWKSRHLFGVYPVCRLEWFDAVAKHTSSFFKSKFLHCVSGCVFFLRFNFTYQMEKTLIEKEQHHRTGTHTNTHCTYMPKKMNERTNERPNEKSMQPSHKHVTIFISLLGVFFSPHHSSVKICSAWSLCCRSQLWSLSSMHVLSIHRLLSQRHDATYFVRIQPNGNWMGQTISIHKCGINMWKFSSKKQKKRTVRKIERLWVCFALSFSTSSFFSSCACDNSCYCSNFFSRFHIVDATFRCFGCFCVDIMFLFLSCSQV